MAAMAVSTEQLRALTELLQADSLTVPDRFDLLAMISVVQSSSWLRFAVGLREGELVAPNDGGPIAQAATEFVRDWDRWIAYRRCVIELRPPNAPPVRFGIDPSVPGRAPRDFPAATFAVITAWNPGSGEPRPNPSPNRRANERLAAHLDARMVERWPAVNAPGSRWQEESFCVLGIDLDEAWRIGEAFQQRAIYYVDQGRPFLVARRRGRVSVWEGSIRVK
jgi:hypothetical protein